MSARDSEYFDGWYADMAKATQRDALWQRHLGLPAGFTSTSVLTFDGLQEVRELLELGRDRVLLDLACGRGGYGLWLARETGARLVGVDFSAVAIGQAADYAAARGLSDRADFRIGTFDDIALPDGSVDAVVCIDAIQFATDISAAAAEIGRVLRPGGVCVLTCWEARERDDERLSERMRQVDLANQLEAGGLTDVSVQERPQWLAVERAMWEEAVDVHPAGDPALESVRAEGERVLPTINLMRRVLATARRRNSAS